MPRLMVHSSSEVKLAKNSEAGGVHRLTDIDTEEVSMVDRAANKKKFLVIKRTGENMATEVRPNGKGGFTTKKNTPSKTKKALEVPPGYKEMATPLLERASEMLDQLTSDLSGSSAADVGEDGTIPGVPAEFAQGITSVCDLLDKVSGMMPTQAADPDADTEDAPPPAGDGGADEATEMQMRAALDNIGKVLGGKVKKAAILKVGAKMSKERFTQLQNAYTVLGNLIEQLSPAPAPAAGAPAGAPPIGKGKKKDDEEETEKGLDPVLAKALGQMAQSIGMIAQAQKKLSNDISSIQKSRGEPTSAPVESAPDRTATKKAYSWPFDINNPMTRDTVDKTDGFFDD